MTIFNNKTSAKVRLLFQRFYNQKGLSALAVIGIMSVVAAFGTAVVYELGTSQVMRTNQVLMDDAFYTTQAGLEYAVRKIYEGSSPVVAAPGQTFGDGSFVISQVGRVITVTGTVNSARETHTMTSPTQAECTNLDVSNADLGGGDDKIQHIVMKKVCLTEVVVDKITFFWVANGGEKLKKIRIESNTVYDDGSGASSGDLIEIPDYTMTNTNANNFNEINFNSSMAGKTVTMTLVMGDTTTVAKTFGPLD